ncbi:MAG TPA: GFA family protein [Devosia sp.]|nr:GFA family protein [Devosia sp.]
MTETLPLPAFTLPAFPQTGGCQCGQVRYRLTAPPIVLYACHCTSCQKQSGSAFGLSLWVRKNDLDVSGSLSSMQRITGSGKRISCDFCPKCGTRLFHTRARPGQTLNIRAGTLDETGWLVPAGHIWTRFKQGWIEISKGTLTCETQPENYDALTARWQEMMQNGA